MKDLVRRLASLGRRGRKGQAMAETAFVLPVVILLLAGMIDLCMLLYAHVQVAAAAYEGARAGSLYFGDLTGSLATNNAGRLVVVKKAVYDSGPPVKTSMGYLNVGDIANFNILPLADNSKDVQVSYNGSSGNTHTGDEVIVLVRYRQPIFFGVLPGVLNQRILVSSTARLRVQ